MITILGTTNCFWRNRFSPRPVLAVRLSMDGAEAWCAETSPLFSVLREWWGDLPSGAAALVAAVAQQLQCVADGVEPDWGLSKRNTDNANPTVFFAYRDHVSAEMSVRLAVEIVNAMLAGPGIIAFQQLLAEGIEGAEAAGFDPDMRVLLTEAERRDVPAMRLKGDAWDVMLGHGAKQRVLRSDEGGNVGGLPADAARVPTAMITGTKGKTTTSLMLEFILAAAGHIVGAANTIGVSVAGKEIAHGDLAGVPGAILALRDPTVTAAVLETARGGIVKWGIYPDSCNIAALLNVSPEQTEIDGIDTVEQMAALKRKVLEGARDCVVLNAENKFCVAMIPDFLKTRRTMLFSMNEEAPALKEHLAAGGEAVILHRRDGIEYIASARGDAREAIMPALDIPAVMNGLIRINIDNALAAAALAIGMEVGAVHIRDGLSRFANVLEVTRGRFNFIDEFPVKILLDRVGPVAAFEALHAVTSQIPVVGKRWLLCSPVGNRPSWHFEQTMTVVAGQFDRYVAYGLEKWRRNRALGEIQRMTADWLVAAGVPAESVATAEDFPAAAEIVAREATSEDFVVILHSDNDVVMEELRAAFAAARGEQHA